MKGVYATGCRNDGEVTNVYGAGMAVLKPLLTDLKFSLGDRKGNSLSSGGDSEICIFVREKGYKIRQLCSNTFVHFIPKERLTTDYILRMAKVYGETSAKLFLIEHPKYHGVLYRARKGIGFLISSSFGKDLIKIRYEWVNKISYWKTRFN